MFWSSPPVPSKHAVKAEVEVPPVSGSRFGSGLDFLLG
jgi:hypothetical protein